MGLADEELEWREVVHNVRFAASHRKVGRHPRWRHGLSVVRRDVLPMLVTAVALTIALLTLVGLIAQQVPWSRQHLFGESPSQTHSTDSPPAQPAAAVRLSDQRPGASADPSATPTPAAASGALALGGASGTADPTPSGPPPARRPLIALPGATVQASLNPSGQASLGVSLPLSDVPLVGQLLPLPSASVGVSLSAPPLLGGLLGPPG